MRQGIILLALLATCAMLPAAYSRSGHIAALSVDEGNETVGGVADMYLEIRPGTGAVYIESFPLTKIDTQISTRFAQETACQRSDVDCKQYDFFYVINVQSSLIGGPSAGGALSVLTYAVLENLPIRNDTAMTGAIMSGGVIGPVGGVQAKVGAAAANGFLRVLIPAWDNDSGIPIADRYNITVIRIKNLDEAIYYFTGQQPKPLQNVTPPPGYTEGMQRVADSLCEHSRIIRTGLDKSNYTKAADEAYAEAVNASNEGAYYSAASMCFSSSLDSHTAVLENASVSTRLTVLNQIIRDHSSLDLALKQTDIGTIADLQLAMIITERLQDVQDDIDAINDSNPDPRSLAFAYERLETARSWFTMIGKIPSKDLDVSKERIAASCTAKIEEAQERINYLAYLYPADTSDLELSLKKAFTSAHNGDDMLCLLQASQAKAEANALLTAVYASPSQLTQIVGEKQSIAEQLIAKQTAAGAFPILGYSYDEYSKQLLAQDPFSASLYAEYSLELSSLDIYFPARTSRPTIDSTVILIFFTGCCIGLVAGIIASHIIHRRESHRPKKRRIAAPLPGKKR